MAWARYDDALPINKKVGKLRAHKRDGIAALGLHLLANTWSRHEGMGGFIPDYQPDQLVGPFGTKLAGILVAVGMFEPCDGGWIIHDYDDFSEPGDDGASAAERSRRISEARAEAGRKGGLAKAKQTASKRLALLQQNPSPVPDPVPEENFTSVDLHSFPPLPREPLVNAPFDATAAGARWSS